MDDIEKRLNRLKLSNARQKKYYQKNKVRILDKLVKDRIFVKNGGHVIEKQPIVYNLETLIDLFKKHNFQSEVTREKNINDLTTLFRLICQPEDDLQYILVDHEKVIEKIKGATYKKREYSFLTRLRTSRTYDNKLAVEKSHNLVIAKFQHRKLLHCDALLNTVTHNSIHIVATDTFILQQTEVIDSRRYLCLTAFQLR
jgi:hypothetical protein